LFFFFFFCPFPSAGAGCFYGLPVLSLPSVFCGYSFFSLLPLLRICGQCFGFPEVVSANFAAPSHPVLSNVFSSARWLAVFFFYDSTRLISFLCALPTGNCSRRVLPDFSFRFLSPRPSFAFFVVSPPFPRFDPTLFSPPPPPRTPLGFSF